MTSTTTASSTRPATLAPADPRLLFARAVSLGGAAFAAVTPDQFELPTPCAAYDVRHMMGHMLLVLDRTARLGRGDDPFQAGASETIMAADDEWLDRWFELAHEVQAAWTDDAVLSRTMTVPWAELPGAAMLVMYLSELTVHTWDLATATGQQLAFDDAAVAASLEAMQRGLPAGARQEHFEEVVERMPEQARAAVLAKGKPFAEPVAVRDDATPIERLAAWTGRDPRQV